MNTIISRQPHDCSHHVSSEESRLTCEHLCAPEFSVGLNLLPQSPSITCRWSASCKKVPQSSPPAPCSPSALLGFGAAAATFPPRGGNAGWWDTLACHQPSREHQTPRALPREGHWCVGCHHTRAMSVTASACRPAVREGWARSEWQLVLSSSSEEGELNNYVIHIKKNKEPGLAPRQTIQ